MCERSSEARANAWHPPPDTRRRHPAMDCALKRWMSLDFTLKDDKKPAYTTQLSGRCDNETFDHLPATILINFPRKKFAKQRNSNSSIQYQVHCSTKVRICIRVMAAVIDTNVKGSWMNRPRTINGDLSSAHKDTIVYWGIRFSRERSILIPTITKSSL